MNQLSFIPEQEPEADHLLAFHPGVNIWKQNNGYEPTSGNENCQNCFYSVDIGLFFCHLIKLAVGLKADGKQHKGVVNKNFICSQWRSK